MEINRYYSVAVVRVDVPGGRPWIIAVYASTQAVIRPRDVRRILDALDSAAAAAANGAKADVTRVVVFLGPSDKAPVHITEGARRMLDAQRPKLTMCIKDLEPLRRVIRTYLRRRLYGLAKRAKTLAEKLAKGEPGLGGMVNVARGASALLAAFYIAWLEKREALEARKTRQAAIRSIGEWVMRLAESLSPKAIEEVAALTPR